MLATRLAHLTPSATLVIANRAAQMKAEGLDVCSLSAGEPNFPTPEHIRAAAIDALHRGETKYGPIPGIPQLRQAIATKLATDQGLTYTSDQIIISNGGKQTLFNLAMVLLNPGDEVIIPVPYWVSYPEIIRLAGAKPVYIPTHEDQGYKITPEQLAAAITPNTKLFVFNSPSNPTGAVYSQEEILQLAQVIKGHSFYIVSDEIYEQLVYDGMEHVSLAALSPELYARTIISNGFSKAYAMTGWRLGFLAGPTEIIQATIRLQSHSTSNVCTFAQYGALAALTDPRSKDTIQHMRQLMADRRNLMFEGLTSSSGFTCSKPNGAFYIFPNIQFTGIQSTDFCERLLEKYHVAVVPGQAFGSDDCIRLSYAAESSTIEKGIDRLQQFVKTLKS